MINKMRERENKLIKIVAESERNYFFVLINRDYYNNKY